MVNNDIIIKNDKTLPKILLIIPFGASNNIFDFFLEKFDDYYVNLRNAENKITIKNYTFYFVEIDGKNNGIFLEKTKSYYEFLKRELVYKETKKTKNLVISKDGIRAEFVFFME